MCIITIIIPTYNSDSTLRNTLDSILNQAFSEYEILIMDSVSKDNTIAIASNYNDDRIKIYSEKDNGIYDAMNKGIKTAKGDWLFFLGSDDILFDEYVLSNIHEFSVNKPYVDLIYGNSLFKHSQLKHYGPTSLERILLEGNICHQSIFYNRSIFSKIGKYNLKYFLYADWDLNIRCFMHPDFCIEYIDIIVSIYNETEGMSAKLFNTDLVFLNNLPLHHIEAQKNYFINTTEFRIGQKILKPYILLKKILKKVILKYLLL